MDEHFLSDEFAIQKAVYESLSGSSKGQPSESHNAFNVKQIFDFINENFDKLRKNRNDVLNVLSLLDRLMRILAKKNGCSTDIGAYIAQLINNHKHDKMNLTSVLQILYQILKSSKQGDSQTIHLSEGVMSELINLLLASDDRQLNANILACLQLYLQLFEKNQIVLNLWQSVTEMDLQEDVPLCATQILIQLFDEFTHTLGNIHKNFQFIDIVQKLLSSKMHDRRKSAHFLMRKVTKVVCEQAHNISQWEIDNTVELELWWNAYIAVMESMEQNQTAYILYSLSSFKSIQCRNLSWKKWIFILYKQLLNHADTVIVRWVLEHILETFTCQDLDSEILAYLTSALNNTYLYNNEDYFLPTQNIRRFLCGDCTPFLEALADIKWASVPLHFWLTKIYSHVGTIKIYKVLLLKLATRMRDMKNKRLRIKAIQLFAKIFTPLIEKMDLADYIILIDTLDNSTDSYIDLKTFVTKFELCTDFDDSITFSQRLYEMLVDCELNGPEISFFGILKILENIPKEKHGWLRFLIVFDLEDSKEKKCFCRSQYDIELDRLPGCTLEEIIEELREKLIWNESEENFVRSKVVDDFINCRYFTEHVLDWSEYLEIGSQKTLLTLSKLLIEYEWNFETISIILDSFVQSVNKSAFKPNFNEDAIKNILEYCRTDKTPEIAQQFAEKLLNIDLGNYEICESVLKSNISLSRECLIRGILFGDAKTEEARIEDAYDAFAPHLKIRTLYINFVRTGQKEIITDLLKLNNELTQKNSKEHCLQIRIVRYIAYVANSLEFWFDELWTALFAENIEPNIKYMYELVVARCAPNIRVIWKKFNEIMNYNENQKVSMIWVVHHYFTQNLEIGNVSSSDQEEMFYKLLPLTMCRGQTGVYSQLIIYNIFQNGSPILSVNQDMLKSNIEAALGDKLTELLTDVRLNLPCKSICFLFSLIMKVTKSPFYEYLDYRGLNEFFESQSITIPNHLTSPKTPKILNEINGNGLIANNFMSYPDIIGISEIYVVASLIEDPLYLDRIVCTCGLLGIKNLICNSNVFKESVTVKNVSNIVKMKAGILKDYLIEKQTEGFKIVGSDKSINTTKLMDFIFPRKCILLLGHEKDGIPCNLLGFLDYAVEVSPYIGEPMNGDLFILEYCKQHF